MTDNEKITIAFAFIPHGLNLIQLDRIVEGIEVTEEGLKNMELAFGRIT